jgi:lipooligosaccharide transport system ATP-binding protein
MIDEGTPDELIERTVGREAVEIEGISEQTLQQLADRAETWYRPFGSSYLIGLPVDNPQPLWEQLSTTSPERLTRRRTNLEDVFLRLTGTSLE